MEQKRGTILNRIRFHRLLTGVMVAVVSVALVVVGIAATSVAERRIRENVRSNTAVVLSQYRTSAERSMNVMYEGFRSLESNYQILGMMSGDLSRGYTPNPTRYLTLWQLCKQHIQANEAILGHIYMSFYDNQMVINAYDQDPLRIRYTYEEWRRRFPDNRYYWVDAATIRDLVPDESVGAVLFRMYGTEDRGTHGILLMTIRASWLQSMLSVRGLYDGSMLALLTDDSTISYADGEEAAFLEENRETVSAWPDGTADTLDRYYLQSSLLSPSRWRLVYLVAESAVSGVRYIVRDMAFIIAGSLAAVAVLAVFLSRRLSRPLQTLTDQVRSREVLDRPIGTGGYTEVEVLGEALESMRRRIQLLLEQVQMEEEDKRRIEIALMQEQINPHFLYNTLNAIMQLCEMGESARAGRMTGALSSFYRIGLSGGRDIITVEEELDHVRSYLLIQHYRYPDMFEYNIDCDEEILPCRIPKMTLQPLVENAIYHGIRVSGQVGNIAVLGGSYDGETAWLEVHDDGQGIPAERLAELTKQLTEPTGTHVGLYNVNQRLRYTFGEGAGLTVTSEPGDTCVRASFRMETEEPSPAPGTGGEI